MLNGYYCLAEVTKRFSNTMDLQYTITSATFADNMRMSFTEHINHQIIIDNKFAHKESISLRGNNRFKGIKKGSVLIVRYGGNWEQGEVIEKDENSGQYKLCIQEKEYWFHVDDENNVKRILKK